MLAGSLVEGGGARPVSEVHDAPSAAFHALPVPRSGATALLGLEEGARS